MKEIKVLGTGCKNCETTAQLNTNQAKKMGLEITLEKVTDLAEILGAGVISTPGVMVNGKVVHSGGVPSATLIAEWLSS
jgi:small redox-active disulfide protein 2